MMSCLIRLCTQPHQLRKSSSVTAVTSTCSHFLHVTRARGRRLQLPIRAGRRAAHLQVVLEVLEEWVRFQQPVPVDWPWPGENLGADLIAARKLLLRPTLPVNGCFWLAGTYGAASPPLEHASGADLRRPS